jgi:hypothetical protein
MEVFFSSILLLLTLHRSETTTSTPSFTLVSGYLSRKVGSQETLKWKRLPLTSGTLFRTFPRLSLLKASLRYLNPSHEISSSTVGNPIPKSSTPLSPVD